MIRTLCLLTLCALVHSSLKAQVAPALIPIPAAAHYPAGSLDLPREIMIYIDPAFANKSFILGHLSGRLATAAGIRLADAPAESAKLRLLKSPASVGQSAESYQLKVSAAGMTISSPGEAGLFYGIQTLWQLLPAAIESKQRAENAAWIVPFAEIEDRPRVAWRGLMLDVARHFFTNAQVKDFIDHMAAYKFNRLHLHLTDDQGWRLEIKRLPRLTSIGGYRGQRTGKWGEFSKQDPAEDKNYGGFYTQDDIRELLDYAKDRQIEILPEIDIPGHSMALLAAYPKLSCTPGEYQVNGGDRFMHWPGGGKFYSTIDNNLCPANEQVYQLLDTIFTEVAELFPFEYIHIGGDETFKGFWEKSAAIKALMQREKLKDMHEVQSYFVKRVAKIVASKGKKMMGWDEIMEGGLAPDAAVMSWQGDKGGIAASKMKHPVVMSPNSYAYVDLYQGDPLAEPPTYGMVRLKKSYEFNPFPAGADTAYILGGQANLWSERLHTVRHAEYMLWPRGWAIAESVWSHPAKKSWNNFVQRVEQHFVRFDSAGIGYSRSMYDPMVMVKAVKDTTIEIELSTEVENLQIHYSFDEFPPDGYYPVYREPLRFPLGASTLMLQTYRNGKPVGKLMRLPLVELRKRARR